MINFKKWLIDNGTKMIDVFHIKYMLTIIMLI